MTTRGEYDDKVIAWFAEQMKAKLSQNEHKGGWENEDLWGLFMLLRDEMQELAESLDFYLTLDSNLAQNPANIVDSLDDIIKEAADVANFAMMVADKARLKI